MDTKKQELRKWAKGIRKECIASSNTIIENIRRAQVYNSAKNIMIFYPLENEINLLPLLKDESKNFYLPKIDGDDLLCCSYVDGEILCESCFKTKEPISVPCNKSEIDLVIVPALCCDVNNYRLGYGGGYYDRFLSDYNGKTMCAISKNLIVENIFPEEHDIKIDFIITD